MRDVGANDYDGPRPTKVGQSPQLSVTVSGTVTAWLAFARRTVNVVCWVPGASATETLPVAPTWVPTSISAFVPAPKRNPWSALLGVLAEVCALTVTCRLPFAAGTTAMPTSGRGAHELAVVTPD